MPYPRNKALDKALPTIIRAMNGGATLKALGQRYHCAPSTIRNRLDEAVGVRQRRKWGEAKAHRRRKRGSRMLARHQSVDADAPRAKAALHDEKYAVVPMCRGCGWSPAIGDAAPPRCPCCNSSAFEDCHIDREYLRE